MLSYTIICEMVNSNFNPNNEKDIEAFWEKACEILIKRKNPKRKQYSRMLKHVQDVAKKGRDCHDPK